MSHLKASHCRHTSVGAQVIGASLSESHTDNFRFCHVYIYAPSVRLTVYFHLENGQDGRSLHNRCVRLKYSPRTASNEKDIVPHEADTPTFIQAYRIQASDEGISPTNLPPRSRISQGPKRSSQQITPLYNAHRNTTKKNTQQHNRF